MMTGQNEQMSFETFHGSILKRNYCPQCGTMLKRKNRGRKRITCSAKCRIDRLRKGESFLNLLADYAD